jgi:hypothetical protein
LWVFHIYLRLQLSHNHCNHRHGAGFCKELCSFVMSNYVWSWIYDSHANSTNMATLYACLESLYLTLNYPVAGLTIIVTTPLCSGLTFCLLSLFGPIKKLMCNLVHASLGGNLHTS